MLHEDILSRCGRPGAEATLMHHLRHRCTMPRLAHLAVSAVVSSKHSARQSRASFKYPVTLKENAIVLWSDCIATLPQRSAQMP